MGRRDYYGWHFTDLLIRVSWLRSLTTCTFKHMGWTVTKILVIYICGGMNKKRIFLMHFILFSCVVLTEAWLGWFLIRAPHLVLGEVVVVAQNREDRSSWEAVGDEVGEVGHDVNYQIRTEVIIGDVRGVVTEGGQWRWPSYCWVASVARLMNHTLTHVKRTGEILEVCYTQTAII